MTDSDVCIACLSSDIKMYSIQNTQLSEIFENLTNTKLSKLEGISQTMCYICYSQLQKCYRFIKMSQKAEEILTQLLSDKVQITPGTVSALDERTNYVTIIKQSSIQLYETDANKSLGENAGCNTNCGSWIDLEILDTVKDEPKDVDSQMTIEDEIVEIKHEPMEAIEYLNPKNSSQLKKECDSIQKTEMITERTCIKNQLDNNTLASNTLSPKSQSYKTSKTKSNHTKKIRSKPKKIHECNMCDLKFGCPANLMRHIRTHTGEKPYSCDHCGKSFSQNGHLIQHMRLHTGEKPYECHVCKNKSFNHRYNYTLHMKKHFGKPTHICDLCKSAFHQQADLKRHMLSHTGEKPYACDICAVKFSQNCHLTQHKKIHVATHKSTEMFPCPYKECTKSFNKRNTLSCHMKSHINGRPYGCLKCEKTFKQKGHLTKHITMVHDKEQHDPIEQQNNLQLIEDKLNQDNLIQEHIEEYIIP